MTSAHNLCETNFDFVKYAWNIATFCVLCLCRTFHLWPRPETSDPVSDTLNSGERASCRHDGDRHHIYCPVYPGTHYYHNLSQLQWKYTNIRNKCDVYLPWFYRRGPRSAPAAVCRSPPAAASWADLTWGSWRRSPWPGGCRPCYAWCPWPARDTCKWKMLVGFKDKTSLF